MLPAPHSNFFENTLPTNARRANGHGRIIVSEEKFDAPMACQRKKLFGPVAAFLGSRIGARWSHILAELADRLGNQANFRKVLPQLAELVEFSVEVCDGQLYHGSGLLKGQLLLAGWRRRLYVCPTSGRLKRMPVLTSCEKCVM